MGRIVGLGSRERLVVTDDDTLFSALKLYLPRTEEQVPHVIVYISWAGMTGGSGDSTGDLTGVFTRQTISGVLLMGDPSAVAAGAANTTVQLYSTGTVGDGNITLRLGNFRGHSENEMLLFASSLQMKVTNGGTAYTGGTVSFSFEGVT